MTPVSGWEVRGLRRRLNGLLSPYKIRGMGQAPGSSVQTLRLLATSFQGALFLSQMSIQTDTIELDKIYTGKSVTIIILKHPTNGTSMNCYLLWIPQK